MLKKIKKVYVFMMNRKINIIENMLDRLQRLKAKTKLKVHRKISDRYDQMKYLGQNPIFQFQEDPFNKSAQGIAFIRQEVLLKKKLKVRIAN